MFWAVFGHKIRTNLIVIKRDPAAKKERVIARIYLRVLDEHLPIVLDYNSIFMQDNALIYKAHVVTK